MSEREQPMILVEIMLDREYADMPKIKLEVTSRLVGPHVWAIIDRSPIAAHDDRIRAEAWDEGYEAHDWTEINPYRHPGPALRTAAGTPTHHNQKETP